jgi:RNA polymerase sigma-70 factor (ECF subfamily)
VIAQGLLGRERVSLAETVISTPPASPTKTAQSYAALDDAQVVEKCAAGDQQALGELYKRYKAEALRFIRHAVRNTQDADDILQEVFVEVARSLRKFEGRAAFSTWLHRICVRTAVRQMKKRYRQVGESAQEDSRPEPADLRPGPDEETATRDRAKRVRALLEQLAPKKRMVLVLHDLEGVSPKEISDLVGAPVLTVRTRLFYARRELAALAARDPALAEFFPAEGGVSDVLSA